MDVSLGRRLLRMPDSGAAPGSTSASRLADVEASLLLMLLVVTCCSTQLVGKSSATRMKQHVEVHLRLLETDMCGQDAMWVSQVALVVLSVTNECGIAILGVRGTRKIRFLARVGQKAAFKYACYEECKKTKVPTTNVEPNRLFSRLLIFNEVDHFGNACIVVDRAWQLVLGCLIRSSR